MSGTRGWRGGGDGGRRGERKRSDGVGMRRRRRGGVEGARGRSYRPRRSSTQRERKRPQKFWSYQRLTQFTRDKNRNRTTVRHDEKTNSF